MKPTSREQWFLDRIGKWVYSNRIPAVQPLNDLGCIIYSTELARGLYNVEFAYKDTKLPIKFFDTIEERDAFENELKNK